MRTPIEGAANMQLEAMIADCVATIDADESTIPATCERVFALPRANAAFVAAQITAGVTGARWHLVRAAFLDLGL